MRVPFNAAIQPGPKTYDLNLNEFSITDERKQAVDFSAPYYDVKQAVVALGDQPGGRGDAIAGRAEGRQARRAGRHHQLRRDRRPDRARPRTPAVFNTNDDAKLALTNGQVDAIVVDLPTAFYITSAELTGRARSSASCRRAPARPSSSAPCWTRAAR